MSRLFPALLAGTLLLNAAPAKASPSRWARARDPELDRREELLAKSEDMLLKSQRTVQFQKEDVLRKARDLLEQGGVLRTRDPLLRYRLAQIYHALQEDEKAVALYTALLHDDVPAPLRARAYDDMAVSYTRLGRYEEEIRAYGQALLLQPGLSERATLLANRAEAYMAIGEITLAVEGYREALSLLSSIEMILGSGPTTLWGLGVALDRAGDLDSGIEAVKLARTYDPLDKRLEGTGWFYSPPYDKYYYQALGYWTAARAADVGAVKAESYGRAIGAWEEYIASAAPDDKWLSLSRVRLKQCEKEHDTWLRGVRRKIRPGSEAAPLAR